MASPIAHVTFEMGTPAILEGLRGSANRLVRSIRRTEALTNLQGRPRSLAQADSIARTTEGLANDVRTANVALKRPHGEASVHTRTANR